MSANWRPSSDNQAFVEKAEAAIHYEQIIMFGILAISILLTTLNMGWLLALHRRHTKR